MSRRRSNRLNRMLLSAWTAYALSLPDCAVLGQQEVDQEETPLRITEPVEDVIADLEAYISTRMQEDDVPGLAIAVVRDNQVVWSAGFGLANRVTGRPVTRDTVFEAASISKVITTYAVLRLVDRGQLALDVPVSSFLPQLWLPPSGYANRITLRHLASHSSGLTENIFPSIDKSLVFAPGSDFLYTGIGFMYMQEVLEQVTGQSLESVARKEVFQPLGMESSSFINRKETMPRMANGHMHLTVPLLLFLVPSLILLTGLFLLAFPITRLLFGKWRLPPKLISTIFLGALILSLFFYVLSPLSELPNFLVLIVLCAIGFSLAFGLALTTGGWLLHHLPLQWQRRGRRIFLILTWGLISFGTLVFVAGLLYVPVPRGPSPEPSAVGSLRTTAGDLANFLIELSEPRYLTEDLAVQMRTPQIFAGEGFSWGLGIGIQHSNQGDALWQNAQTFGFRGLMVVYQEHDLGVVVLTNSNEGYRVACDVAGRTLGGKALWEYF